MPIDSSVSRCLVDTFGAQNEVLISGDYKYGEGSGTARVWLTDFEMENLCGSSYTIFKRVTKISLITRHLTPEEAILANSGNPKVYAINGPAFRQSSVASV